MTFTYQDVYVTSYSTVGGPYEKKGPLGTKLDKSYKDLYMGEDTWEQAEVKLLKESIEIVLNKGNAIGDA